MMNRARMISAFALLVAPMITLLLPMQQPLSAQDATPAAKAPAKPRGRLPAYYGQVVSSQQREKIYSLQISYAERIEALEAQLAELKEKLNSEIRGVLTPEQQKKVDELTEAARKNRSKSATTTAGTETAASTAKAAATSTPATTPKRPGSRP